MKKLPLYKITIDDMYAEDGENLGVSMIAFTNRPAIKIKGMAFSSDEPKQMIFKDNLKYRIAAPIMIPSRIYRCDDSEYYVEFTTDEIEKIHSKMMATLPKNMFNLEHDSEDVVPAYPLEMMLVDSENKMKLIKDEYGIDVPMGSSFMVAQFTDKDYYNQIVENDQIGFSIEGFLGLKMSEILNNNLNKIDETMKQTEFKLADGTILELLADGTYEIKMGEDKKEEYADLPVEEDKVIEDIRKDAVDEEKPKEEMADAPVDVPAEVPAEAPAKADSYSKEEIDAKFEELYNLIADLKVKEDVPSTEDMAPMAMSLHERFGAFVRFSNKDN